MSIFFLVWHTMSIWKKETILYISCYLLSNQTYVTYFVYYLIRSPTGDPILPPPEFICPLSKLIIHTLHCFSEKYISIITNQRSQVYVKKGKEIKNLGQLAVSNIIFSQNFQVYQEHRVLIDHISQVDTQI